MVRQISEERKMAYYLGAVLMVIGFLLFASNFVIAALNVGNFSNSDGQMKASMLRGIGGMALIALGAIIRGIGARGLAGSGTILDPEGAREDLEPYARMAGGMVKDVLDEADIRPGASTAQRVVMIKCRSCGKLNEEDSKFCQECGLGL